MGEGREKGGEVVDERESQRIGKKENKMGEKGEGKNKD